MTATVAVDFDGVIHRYSVGWQDGRIYDPPMPGALAAIRHLMDRFAVYVHTTRDPRPVAEGQEQDRRNEIVRLVDSMGGLEWLRNAVWNVTTDDDDTGPSGLPGSPWGDPVRLTNEEFHARIDAATVLEQAQASLPMDPSGRVQPPDPWSDTPCKKCGYKPPCQCPGNPSGEGTGL